MWVLKRFVQGIRHWWFKKQLGYRQKRRQLLQQSPQNLLEQLLILYFKYPKESAIIFYSICSTVVVFSAFSQYVLSLH